MKYIIIALLLLVSCAPKKPEGSDLIEEMDRQKAIEERLNELSLNMATSDTLANKEAPVQVTEVRVNKGINGGFKEEAFLEFKNVSGKPVDGIRIRVHCFNNFGEPAGGKLTNTFYCEFQETYNAEAKGQGLFSLVNYPGATKVYAAATEVHFVDGSRWVIDSTAAFKK